VRPHQSLGYLTPREFLVRWNSQNKRKPSVTNHVDEYTPETKVFFRYIIPFREPSCWVA
jgi:hypothetical protein